MARAQHPADAPAAADEDAAPPGTATTAPGPGRARAALFSCSPSGTVLTAGTELARLTGRPLGALSGVPAHELFHPSSSDLLRYVLRTARGGAASGAATFRLRHADGSSTDLPTCWSVLAGASPDATQLVFVRADGAVADLTYGPRARSRAGALPDGAVHLPDRGRLLAGLTCALDRAEHSTAVLVVDLDGFRMVNASRGHDVGDQLLAGVGARLRAGVSPDATVARCGDDEFLVVCEDTAEDQAHALAHRLLDVVAEPFPVGDAAVTVTASIGVAVAPAEPGVPALELLRHADTALHAGKSAGRGRVHVFERTPDEDLEHRYELATDLRAALADEAVHLEYQPIVDLRSGAVVGLEALARWTHPAHGPVAPSSFVTVAELSGLAPELDRRVLRRALVDAARLRREQVVPEDAYVAVNLSAASLTDATLLDDLVRWTEETGLPPTRLVLEITETAIMQNTDVAVALLRGLRDHGVRVAMDDFGTGYSSLAYLRDLPISALKIDRSFVADIAGQRDALAIVAWIVDLARAVGVAVVAEGVETTEQVALLQGLGCVTAQGWLWGPAVPVSTLLGRRTWTRPLTTRAAPVAATRTTGRDAGVSSSVQRLLELHRNGASATTIAATLNAERLCTPTGVRWHGAGVARVLAHQIRRCAGLPDAAAGPRRPAWRRESAGRAPS
ncbi:diguanylate cyclase (GGDEF) domain-containing protein [Geodermatophilus africanus]|uniref:Diguanylate cyclase (GGDEF) domain-containing protein n=1 Tax=Geodermatophilus africanus TaxID=1137993 RepID=A0A1H3HDY4_9ACTN|nr:bifunctional diguanylate cyclase/phosphodiesterase [Geodermatophilus africanus]SDY13793.1 diguanylate cyclase (GGDEF) domain-containing protein [Geodermatophilus africanus]